MKPKSTRAKLKAFVAVITLMSAFFARADYPIASHHYAADPAAVEFNGRFYVYCSNDDENGTNGYLMSSITCFSTGDLKNWTDHGVVFRATNSSWASLTWAPSAVSNQSKVFLYFANGAGSIGVATSSVPSGPFSDARGSSLINSSTPGASTPNQWLFDPCGFVDDDGQAYLYFGGQYPTNARVIRLNSNLTSVNGSASPMFATNLFEASYMHKRNGIYYYTYCNRFEFGAAIYCETNSNPTNGFVPQGTVLANPPQNVNNNNHSSIAAYLGNWYILYHNRAAALANGLSNPEAVYKRSLCIDAINYNADGSIQQVTPTTDGLTQLKNLDPYKRVEAETFAQPGGVKTEVCSEGGMDVTSITNGAWVRIRGVNFGIGAAAFYTRVASAGSGGNIELRLDSLAGTFIGTCAVPVTGGAQTWTTIACNVTNASGVHDLYLKFTGGAGNLFNVNWWQFQFGSSSNTVSSVTFEAESGTLGSNFTNGTAGAIQFISVSTDTMNAGNPGNTNRMATYTVTFPGPGTYKLYGRARVGAGGANDDSFFYENGFGVKSITTDADWVLVNGINTGGFTNAGDVVSGSGSAGVSVWKWISFSDYTGLSGETPVIFSVPVGNLTQTFQIGARENGLDFDKFAFGSSDATFTVSNLDAGVSGTPPAQLPTVTVNTTNVYQTIEGLGGAICFYNNWVTAHPYKLEIFTNAFAGLNLSMLRLGNWFRYQGTSNFDPDAPGFVTNASRVLGHPVPVYMSSWSPPASLKSNGQVGNGGTLITNSDGSFAYTNFANYWYDSIQAYKSNGVNLTWASIQNEPDWVASYDSCIFHPTEDTVNGTNYASYSKALDAVYQKLTNLPAPPKLLGPECVHISFNDLKNYAATMNSNSFYGVAHHLYGDGGSTGESFLGAISSATNVFPAKSHFMTEYGDVFDMIECANLIHNSLVVEQVSGYNHWNLIWPGTNGGLIQIENPYASQSTWTNAPPGTPTQSHGWWYSPSYWSMKHFSFFIQPGFKRVSATDNDSNVRSSAYISPDGLRLVAVLINTNPAVSSTLDLNFASFPFVSSSVYQTAGTNYYFKSLGPAGSQLTMPSRSLTTVVLDKFVVVGPAINPSPAQNQTGVTNNAALNWTSGSNAVTHAIYLGISSNAVSLATPASPEFKGIVSTNSLAMALSGSVTYFWRVDEIAGVNTNTGVIWSFTTVPVYTISPMADSYVESSNPNSNFGISTNLLVKNNLTVAARNTYLLFDVHSLANVQSATLTLTANRVDDPTVTMYYELASTNWTENGITWNNQSGGTGLFLATNTVTVGVPVVLNVASAVVSKATNGGLLSIRITQPTNNLNGLIQFCSKEHPTNSWRPVLTYTLNSNTPPTLAAISNRTVNVGVTLNITNSATDTDVPAQALNFSLLSAPTNATLNTNSGVLIWRPLLSQQNTTNSFTVMVTDNGTPSLSATTNFTVTVNPASQPVLSSIALGSQVSLTATGMIGPDYVLFTSTNLANWQLLFTTNPAAMPVTFTDTNCSDATRFYRLQLGP